MPHTAPFFSAIPTPLQVSLDWNVATTNLLIVALLALVLRVSVATSTNILGAQEALLKRYLDPILRWWRPIADAVIKLLHKIPHLVTTIAGNIIFLLVMNGLLFAFLDIRFKPWAGAGMQIFPTMLLGYAAAGMIGPIVRARVLNRWREPHHFGFNAANLFLGVVCVGVSRLLSLSPGIIMGNAGGLLTPTLTNLPLERRSRLVMAGVIGTGVVGLGAWLATLLLPLAAIVPITAGLVQLFRGPFSTLQDIFLLAFIGCLTNAFFTLLPVPNSPGLTVASKNLVGWVAGFLISGFLFFQLILNKNTGITTLLQERGYLLVPLVVLSLAVTLVLYFVSKAMAVKAAAAAKS